MNKLGIIFDLDGTLWDTTKQVVPAWNRVLNRYPQLNKKITYEEMEGFMGKTIEDISEIMFPDMEEVRGVSILMECCREEQVYLRTHGGVLYPKLEETLIKLSHKYHLFIVSNSHDGYVQTFLDYHQLNKYFIDIEMAGRTGKSKGENIKIIMKRNKLEKAIYIGDTEGDQKGANDAGIPFVYAKYGFGNVDDTKYAIGSISEIVTLADEILDSEAFGGEKC